ncbi:MAG: hypothetical protein R6V02_08785 [Candidatus Aminicenantes bacterium]
MRNRHRWIYQMTGIPGWMRLGYSPGWAGRSPSGLGPAAQYLMTGTWPTPQMASAWRQGTVPYYGYDGFPLPGMPTPYDPWGAASLTPEQELHWLHSQAEWLEDELSGIETRIQELKGEKS